MSRHGLAMWSALLAACAGTLDDPARFAADGDTTEAADGGALEAASPAPDTPAEGGTGCADVPTTILALRCVSAGCHDSKTASAGLDLQSPDVGARLVGKSATGGAGTLIDPGGDPDKSILYTKLTATPPFGARMPIGASLSSTDLACVGAWVRSLATLDGGADGEVTMPTDASSDETP